MKITIITESLFGCTSTVADRLAAGARAEGAEVQLMDAASAPSELPPKTDVLVVAAPTHNLGLPTEKSRSAAQQRGATRPSAPGVREWVDRAAPRPDVRLVCVSTVSGGHSGSAARSAAKLLRGKGFGQAEVADFRISGTPPTLVPSEGSRAEAIGAALVTGAAWPDAEIAPSESASGPKKSLWKRWWFWVGLAAIVAAAVMLWPNPNVGDRTKVPPALSVSQQSATAQRTVTRAELAAADGSKGMAWVAVSGIVYDVSGFGPWSGGKHHGVTAGTDATEQFINAPHNKTFLERAPVVGRLAN